jgi:hypothetical protein
VGCRIVGVDGREVRDKAALFAALGRVRGHAEFAIDTAVIDTAAAGVGDAAAGEGAVAWPGGDHMVRTELVTLLAAHFDGTDGAYVDQLLAQFGAAGPVGPVRPPARPLARPPALPSCAAAHETALYDALGDIGAMFRCTNAWAVQKLACEPV